MRYIGETHTAERVRKDMPVVVRRGGGDSIGIWIVTGKATGQKIGDGIPLPLPIEQDDNDWDLMQGDEIPDTEIEVGYMLKPAARGKGYATEVATRLLRFAFEPTSLPEVVAVTGLANQASRRVLLKSGMNHRGQRYAYKCEVEDFHISREQWMARGLNNA